MSESTEDPKEQPARCPKCDSVIDRRDERCLMCGEPLVTKEGDDSEAENGDTKESGPDPSDASLTNEHQGSSSRPTETLQNSEGTAAPGTIESVMVERQSRITMLLAVIAVIIIGLIAAVILRFPVAAEISFIPTETLLPPTITFTPSWTPLPAVEEAAVSPVTSTPEPPPSDTPQSPRTHTVTGGETMFGLGLRYSVSSQSIADANGLSANAGLLVSQQLLIPWPTATPPLVPVAVEVSGQTIIADPTDCGLYEIKGGDTLLGVASRNRVDYRALLAVNRLTDQSILQPGDEICIPTIIRSGILPPTPGPSPTPSSTPPPDGPHLMVPLPGAQFDSANEPIIFQWVAVKDLSEEEWYMVEMTDLTAVDSHPHRAFVRQTSFVVPSSWRPTAEEMHHYRWQVSVVRVTGQRYDGQFTYTFGGVSSKDGTLFWQGSVPTAGPAAPSPLPTASPLSDSGG